MDKELTTNTKLEDWTAAMAAGKQVGTLGELLASKNLKVYKDQYLRYESGDESAWVYVSETTRAKNLDPSTLRVTLRDKINGDPGKVAQATAPGGRDANAADLSKLFG